MRFFQAWARVIGPLSLSSALLMGGCVTHTAGPPLGRLASQLIVDNGVGDLAGRVLYLHVDRRVASVPIESPVPGADIEVLDLLGHRLGEIPASRTGENGRFHVQGLAIGEAYVLRAIAPDPQGRRRQLLAYVRPEQKFTCVELSLASTLVAQKILADPERAAHYDPTKLGELVETLRRTLADMLTPPETGPAPDAPPPVSPPPAAAAPPGDNGPRATVWVPGPEGHGGYWCAPGSNSQPTCWWIPGAGGGGCWWAPKPGAPAGAWWVSHANGGGQWVTPQAAGAWVAMPGTGELFTTSPVPPGGLNVVWIPASDGTGGGYWYEPGQNGKPGRWWLPGPGGQGGAWSGPATPGASPSPAPSKAPGAADERLHWITWPDGSGRGAWWAPGAGGQGGAWWTQTGDGGGGWWTPGAEPHSRATTPKPSASCGCHWVSLPGMAGGYWYQPDPSGGSGGSWWIPVTGGGGFWDRATVGAGAGPAPFTPPPPRAGWEADCGCQAHPGAGGGYFYVRLPNGAGGAWWAPPAAGGGAGSFWITESTTSGGTRGRWWSPPASPGPTPVPPPSASCGCHWVPFPNNTGGAWWLPGGDGTSGSWWLPGAGGGGTWWSPFSSQPAYVAGAAGTIPGAAAGPAGRPASGPVWMPRPGGGATWWMPDPSSPGGAWWIPSASGGYWYRTVITQTGGPVWVPAGGGSAGGWWYPAPNGVGGCCWVPTPDGGGQWVWVYPSAAPSGSTPPAGGPAGALSYDELMAMIDQALTPVETPTGGPGLFDRLATGRPDLTSSLGKALETYLDVNVVMPFKAVNRAPFPTKEAPRYLFVAEVNLGCTPEGPAPAGVTYALNGEAIARVAASESEGNWRVRWDSRQKPDGVYFFTAHETPATGAGLGRMLARGYAHIKNAPASDDPCEQRWDGLP